MMNKKLWSVVVIAMSFSFTCKGADGRGASQSEDKD